MEVSREQDQRDVDRGQVVSQPAGQIDVRDRAARGADTLCDWVSGHRNPLAAKIRVSVATTLAATATRPSDRFRKPAQSTYSMQDSIENHASVRTSLIARSAIRRSTAPTASGQVPGSGDVPLRGFGERQVPSRR